MVSKALHISSPGLMRGSKGTIADLEREVRTGKCHLVLDGSGEVIRVVRLVVLRLMNKDMLCWLD